MAMPWEQIFSVANTWALICWVILAFAPRPGWLQRGLFLGGSGLLAMAYAVLIIGLLSGSFDGGTVIAGGSGGMDFTTLPGVQSIFMSQGGATIGWIHYLAFDLFVGIWVARNADSLNISRILQVPVLFFTFMAGPFGLVLYLILRAVMRGQQEMTEPPC